MPRDLGMTVSGTGERTELVTKGEEVEEWLDLHFFRPLGARIARAALPTPLSPDHLTLICLVLGLVAGHLCFYANPWINGAGFVLFIISDIFDSADGQLARLRGVSTRWGRILDGLSDNARFINLYINLLARLLVAGWALGWAVPFVFFAGMMHSFQSSTIDFVRSAWLTISGDGGGESTAAREIVASAGASWLARAGTSIYRRYVARQQRMFPKTWRLVQLAKERALDPVARSSYRHRSAPLLHACTWLGQNFRFAFIGACCVMGWPAGVMWITAVPLTLLAFIIVIAQEQASGRVATMAMTPAPSPAPAPAQWRTAGR